jgi:murein DD-endopeptidase MepM/ murein hydrolase activator NlpD
MVAAIFRLRPGAVRLFAFLLAGATLTAQPFQPPTANHALFEPGGEERFFTGTAGKPPASGCYGCVRSDGWQMHEGLDIRCLQRDKRGEPADPVLAAAEGTVAYVSLKAALSNYGNYVVLRHHVDGLEVYSLYAHLSGVRSGLAPGQTVRAGEVIATMGRTSNTRQRITKDRAHVHFELNLFLTDRFAQWFKKNCPGERDDHAQWNGQNLLGLDPRLILVGAHDQGEKFGLLNFVRSQTEVCRVVVRSTGFSWLKRYPALIRPNLRAQKEGVAGYELALNFNGIPFELIPRAASEIKGRGRFQLLSVNEAEYHKNPCRKLVKQHGSGWELAPHGLTLLDQLTF